MRARFTVLVLIVSFVAVQAASAIVAIPAGSATTADWTVYGEHLDIATGEPPAPGQLTSRLLDPPCDDVATPTAALPDPLLRIPAFLTNCTLLL